MTLDMNGKYSELNHTDFIYDCLVWIAFCLYLSNSNTVHRGDMDNIQLIVLQLYPVFLAMRFKVLMIVFK